MTAQQFSSPNDPRFKEIEENIVFTLRFPSGVLATCTSSYNYESVKRFRVFGEKGYLDLDPATDYKEHTMHIGTKDGELKVKLEEGNQFAAQLDHMAECVLNNKTPKTPGEEGLKDVRIMLAIYEAAEKGKAVKV